MVSSVSIFSPFSFLRLFPPSHLSNTVTDWTLSSVNISQTELHSRQTDDKHCLNVLNFKRRRKNKNCGVEKQQQTLNSGQSRSSKFLLYSSIIVGIMLRTVETDNTLWLNDILSASRSFIILSSPYLIFVSLYFGILFRHSELEHSDYSCLQIGCVSEDSLLIFSLPQPVNGHDGIHPHWLCLPVSVCCQVLHEEWARYSAFYKYQPIDLVR